MPRPAGTKAIHYHLPEDHPALRALDAYCREWDKSRADATKDLVIAWAKARQGDMSALSGLFSLAVGSLPVQSAPRAKGSESLKDQGRAPTRSPSRNAEASDLDL